MTAPALSIIVPMWNEASQFPALARHLRHWQARGCEVIVVDGGSNDDCTRLASQAGLTVVVSARGRAVQMNHGARQAGGAWLLFLHADSRLPVTALDDITTARSASGRCWGRFDVRIDGESWLLPWVARLMNWRSRVTGIATGDQALFVERSSFERLGGFAEQPLMEDIELSRRLKAISRPMCLGTLVTTCGRRWSQHGVCKTIFLMWQLRFAYWRGVAPDKLAQRYG